MSPFLLILLSDAVEGFASSPCFPWPFILILFYDCEHKPVLYQKQIQNY